MNVEERTNIVDFASWWNNKINSERKITIGDVSDYEKSQISNSENKEGVSDVDSKSGDLHDVIPAPLTEKETSVESALASTPETEKNIPQLRIVTSMIRDNVVFNISDGNGTIVSNVVGIDEFISGLDELLRDNLKGS